LKDKTGTHLRRIRIKYAFLITLFFGFGGERVYAAGGVETAGNVLLGVLPTMAGGLTLYRHDVQGMVQLAESLGSATLVTFMLKYAVNETRPDGGHYSFPSGHTSASVSSAEFLRKRYGWKWDLPAYAAAVFVGYSRVQARRHYTHDVLAGAAIGFLGGALFTKPFARMNAAFDVSGKNGWIRLSYRWP
jgi:membrane-associated phospholipid phosphatase